MPLPRHRKKLLRLLEKYRDGRTTPAENRFIELYSAYFDLAEPLPVSDIQGLEDALLARIHAGMRVVPFYRRTGVRVAAACLVALLAVGGWMVLRPRTHSLAAVLPHHGAPGTHGAVLTLAGGRQLVLDSGISVPRQGLAIVTNQQNVLTYRQPAEENITVVYNTLSTGRGHQYQLVLPDGSRVWLNAASSITYPTTFQYGPRQVSVTGEVYFEVAPYPDHPFEVRANGTQVTVLGTHFDVMAYPDEPGVSTTLLEGSVEVDGVRPKPGQQVRLGVIRTVDTTDAVAWVKGQLSMQDVDIAALMRQISRWYDVDIVLEGPIPPKHLFGMINRNTVYLSDIFEVLEASGLKIEWRDHKVFIRSG